MAWIDCGRSGVYNLRFRFKGQHYTRSLQTHDEKEASDLAGQARQTLRNIKLGVIVVPENADLATFVLSAGRAATINAPAIAPTLTEMMANYFAALPSGGLEAATVEGMKIRQKQLERLLGAKTKVTDIDHKALQTYINARAKESSRPRSKDKAEAKRVSAATVKKALVTLRTVWNWGIAQGSVKQPFPGRGLRYPKGKQKPPFQTRSEIERQLKGLSVTQRKAVEGELWDSLYLTTDEIKELLKFVAGRGRFPFIYPLVVTAAHTGARRAELMRMTVADVNLHGGCITIQERKKSHSQRTQRKVQLSPLLKKVLDNWLKSHPGGQALFYQTESGRKKLRSGPEPLTRDEVHHHFKETLKGSKWAVIKGLHCLRHSFVSALACQGKDQRIIDEFVGHCTEEQRRRYRHLYPNVAKQAIMDVFG